MPLPLARRTDPVTLFRRLQTTLLVHRHWEQVVFKNMVWATLGEAVVRGLKLAVLPLIARVFGPVEFGKFAFAFSFASMFNIIFDLGLATTTTREMAAAKQNEEVLPDILLLKLALGAVGLSAAVLGMLLITRDPELRTMIVILAAACFVLEFVNLSFAVFRARQRMEYEFLARMLQAILLVGAVALVAWRSPSVTNVSFAYLVSGILTLAAVAARAGPAARRVSARLRPVVWRRLLGVAVPLALAGGATTVYMNIDTVLLGAFGKIADTGWYNLAARIVGVLLVPTGLVSLVVLPAFAATASRVDEEFRRRWDRWSSGMIALGAYLGCVAFAAAGPVVRLTFGPAFDPTSTALRILSLTVVLIFVYTPSFQALIVFDRQRTLFVVLAAGAAVNVALNVLLIPTYGFRGAAWATVVTHAVLLCGLIAMAHRTTPVHPFSRPVVWSAASAAVAVVLASAAMGAVRTNVWLAVPMGSAVFAASLAWLARIRVVPAPAGIFSR